MALTIGETSVDTVPHWAMGRKTRWPGGPEATNADAAHAGQRTAAKAHTASPTRLRPGDAGLHFGGAGDG